MAARFYVYRLFNESGLQYIGKGSGRRLKAQMRRFACSGEIVAEHPKERDAYAHERRLITELKPPRNRHPGGNGGRATPVRIVKTKAEIEFSRIGPRRYAAQQLLRFDLAPYLAASEIDKVRQVANGPWR